MEISQVVDQRRRRVLAFIEDHGEQLAKQGTVVESFRRREGRLVGPYFRLTLRLGRVQQSVYLGNDLELVAEVRAALTLLRKPERERRAVRRQRKAVRKALSECRAQLRLELAQRGLRLQGYEVRGWRTPGPRATPRGEQSDQGQSRSGATSQEPLSRRYGTRGE